MACFYISQEIDYKRANGERTPKITQTHSAETH